MKKSKFGILLLVLLSIATIYYLATTRRDDGLVLVGTVDANQVIVSAKIQGRIEKLAVDEGTTVKAGDVIADTRFRGTRSAEAPGGSHARELAFTRRRIAVHRDRHQGLYVQRRAQLEVARPIDAVAAGRSAGRS